MGSWVVEKYSSISSSSEKTRECLRPDSDPENVIESADELLSDKSASEVAGLWTSSTE